MAHAIKAVPGIQNQKLYVVFEVPPKTWDEDRDEFEKRIDQELNFGIADLKVYIMEQFDLLKKAGVK